jgi:hypothetical protein
MSAALNKVFKGKFVRVYSTKQGMMHMSEDGGETSSLTVAHQGFFVDSDDNFVILGDKKGKKLIGIRAVSYNLVEDIELASEHDVPEHSPINKGELN